STVIILPLPPRRRHQRGAFSLISSIIVNKFHDCIVAFALCDSSDSLIIAACKNFTGKRLLAGVQDNQQRAFNAYREGFCAFFVSFEFAHSPCFSAGWRRCALDTLR